MTTRQLSASQGLPLKYLEAILTDLRRSGILTNERGPAGGFRLARSPDEISLHEAVEPLVGSLVEIRGRSPEATEYGGSAEGLQSVWMTLRAHLRAALERVTIADIVASTVSTAGDPAVGSGAALPTGSR
jgi:Rrf2 family protein